MALPPLVEAEAFEQWLGEPLGDAAAQARAAAVLRAASMLVRRETGRAWLASAGELDDSTPTIDVDDLDVAQTVVKQVAERKWRNPGGVVHETTGPFSARYSEDAGKGLHLTDIEEELLAPYKTTKRSGIWALSTTRGDVETTTTYLEVEYSSGLTPAEPIPWLPREPS